MRLATETFNFWPPSTTIVGSVIEDTEHQRSGAACAAVHTNGALAIAEPHIPAELGKTVFYRVAFRIDELPAAAYALARIRDSNNTILEIALQTNGKVHLWAPVEEKNPAGEAAITLGQYFVVEVALEVPEEGKGTVAWRFDGELKNAGEAMSFRNIGASRFWIGNPGGVSSPAVVYIDDVAINDNTGAKNNTWVGVAPDPPLVRKPCYPGAFIAENSEATAGKDKAPFDLADFLWDEFEAQIGRGVGILHLGDPWEAIDPETGEGGPEWDGYFTGGRTSEIVHERGAILMKDLGGPENVIQDVNAGVYDDSWVAWAESARDYARPFFLRLWWEMNGTWFHWGRQACEGDEFVQAWRRIHRIVSSIAPNVTFVWCCNALFQGHADPFGDEEKETESFYPGDAYVDWTSVDGYTGQNPHKELGFRSSKEVFLETYNRLQEEAPSKPIMIAEVGCSEYVKKGGGPEPPHKAEWIRQLLEWTVPFEMPNVRAVVWFNWRIFEGGGYMDWPIESSESATDAFAVAVEDSHYVVPAVDSFASLTKVPLPGEISSGPVMPVADGPAIAPAEHFSFPFRIEGGAIATVPQDSPEEVTDCVAAAVNTRLGSRLEAPEYGVPSDVFKPQLDVSVDDYLRAAEAAEPRAQQLTGNTEAEGLLERLTIVQEDPIG